METQPNFEFLCRVCAANTKGKNSVAECVYILKTPSLRDKIEKYLYLSISETDILPKVLCKTCFRQVEATASLSKIAKHTQKVFRDFLLCTKPGTSHHDYNNIDIEAKSDSPPAADAAREPTTTTSTMPKLTVRKDEVVVNVSITDPLTRENSHKILNATTTAQQQQQQQRRQNSLESRFTPKSIAQRAFTSTPKPVPSCTSIVASPKKPSPPGVINFVRPPVSTSTSSQTQPLQQVTTFTSGGYIIGRMATPGPGPGPGAGVGVGGARTASETSNVLQQKRRNLKMALNNIRASAVANSSGQVSLLKSSQRQLLAKKPELEISSAPAAESGEGAPDPAAEEPPLIKTSLSPQAAEPQAQDRPPGIPEDVVLGRVIKDVDLLKLILKALKWPVTKQTLDAQMQRLKSSKFLDVMSDPNLLQDMDLTQILGPYLAPVLLAAQAIQQQQLAAAALSSNNSNRSSSSNTASATLTSDVQTQASSSSAVGSVVGLESAIPYKLPAGTSVQLVPATAEDEEAEEEAAAAAARKSKPEKRPYSQFLPPKKVRKTSYRPRDSLIVISDEEEVQQDAESRETSATVAATATSARRFSKSSPDVAAAANFRVDIDPAFLSQFAIGVGGSGDSSNDALLALLNRQRAALSRLQRGQRRRRSNTSLPAPFDVDDFVLVEPPSSTPGDEEEEDGEGDGDGDGDGAQSADDTTSNTTSASSSSAQLPFPVPVQVSMPLITRPIIKRRKTVIQASPGRTALNIATTTTGTATASTITTTSMASAATSTTSTTQFAVPTAPKALQRQASDSASVSTVNTIATQVPSSVISIATQVPSTDNKLTASTAKISASTTTSSSATTLDLANSDSQLELKTEGSSARGYGGKKVNPSKSALGQQLLEAIGLQKVSCDADEPDEAKSQVSVERSRRQKSLLARKQEEPTVADADSTTKSIVKEVLVEARHKNETTPSASDGGLGIDIDIEEQIDKIALVVQNNRPRSERQAPASRIPEIRRRSTVGSRSRKSTSLLLDSKKENSELNTIEEVKEDSDTKLPEKATEATQTDDDEQEGDEDDEEAENLDQSTSTTTTFSVHIHENISSSDANSGKESTTSMSPRKRGRKRYEDKDPDFVEPGRRDTSASQRNRAAGRGRAAAIVAKQRVRDLENESSRTSRQQDEDAVSISSIKRPARVSKTMSKYYKGPEQPLAAKRSQTSTGRVTRNRN